MVTKDKNKGATHRGRPIGRKRSRSQEQKKKKQTNDTKAKPTDPIVSLVVDAQSRRPSKNQSRGDDRKEPPRGPSNKNDRRSEQSPPQQSQKQNNRNNRTSRGQESKEPQLPGNNFFKPQIAIEKEKDLRVLWWNSPTDYVPFASEEAMINVLMTRKKNERGMMRCYLFRLKEINDKLDGVGGSMTLLQALSLRRHHIQKFNPKAGMSRLGLGLDFDIRKSADIFENCVQDFLNKSKVAYWTEQEQKEMFQETEDPGLLVGTPDFFLRRQVLLRKARGGDNNKVILEERKINWVEAKMFYGASTIPQGSPGAVGSLLRKLKKYVQAFGPGAICFMNGCGDRLAAELSEIGVSVLDCSGTVALARVREHQRTWCATRDGKILN
jgi:hypothetical protein